MDGIYLDVGDSDELGLTPVVLSFHKRLLALGIERGFFMFEGGARAMGFVRRTLAEPLPVSPAQSLPITWGEVRLGVEPRWARRPTCGIRSRLSGGRRS